MDMILVDKHGTFDGLVCRSSSTFVMAISELAFDKRITLGMKGLILHIIEGTELQFQV